jgi:Mg-chelatase subunit ChlD
VLALVERHFDALSRAPHEPFAPELVQRLTAQLARQLGGPDWREASRAVAIGRALPDEAAVPPLIEGLDLWTERHLAGGQGRRLQAEIARDIERRSGRAIGAHAEGWRQWWRAVREGRIPLDVAERGEQRSVASFFGLRPSSDRLVFVLDRSGSMDWAFGAYSGTSATPGRTRYEEAREQLLGFLRASGPRTRFTVILFESGTQAWSRTLRPADEETLEELDAWLGARRPGGGTELRPAVLRAVGEGPAGLELEELEVDTVIVLCDGETAEGAAWAGAFAARLHEEARVAIHCVQVGPAGDGTLERLAAGTGGDYVRVDG